ncbi:unnamed protein product, partial [Scytosiphon promiscuus]
LRFLRPWRFVQDCSDSRAETIGAGQVAPQADLTTLRFGRPSGLHEGKALPRPCGKIRNTFVRSPRPLADRAKRTSGINTLDSLSALGTSRRFHRNRGLSSSDGSEGSTGQRMCFRHSWFGITKYEVYFCGSDKRPRHQRRPSQKTTHRVSHHFPLSSSTVTSTRTPGLLSKEQKSIFLNPPATSCVLNDHLW